MTADRFSFLDDIEDTLWEATQQTIDEALAAGRHPEHRDAADTCAWCGHTWHGLACTPLTWNPWAADGEGDWAYDDCGCTNASTPIDDTWRAPPDLDPVADRAVRLMHTEGLDGWAAHARTSHSWCDCRPCVLSRHVATRRRRRTPSTVIHRCNGYPAFIQSLLDAGAELVMSDRSAHTPLGVVIDVELRGVDEAFGRLVESVRGGVLAVADAMEHIVAAFGDRTVAPNPEPIDPRARALAVRQHRNTGPDRTPAGQARRPQRHRP